MNRILFLASTALLVAQAPCQVFVPTNTPTTGTCNVFPFGQSSSKMQFLAPAANLGTAPLNICDIAFAPCGTYNITFRSLEIRMAQTDATVLNTNFALNMKSNVKTVFKATNYRWSVTANTWNEIGLDSSYLYIPGPDPNLVIEIVLEGLTGGGSFHRDVLPRCWSNGWTGSPPATGTSAIGALKYELVTDRAHLKTYGLGCTGSNNQSPTLSFTGNGQFGTSLGIDLSNGPASSATLLSVNVMRNEPAIDLGIIGAPGCRFYVSNLATLGGATDATGASTLKVLIPRNAAVCVPVYLQYFPLDPNANALGMTSSNYGRVTAGK